jgi:hypothetical protein
MNNLSAKVIFNGPTKEQAEKIQASVDASFAQYLAAKTAHVPGSCYHTNEDGTCNAHDCKLHGLSS